MVDAQLEDFSLEIQNTLSVGPTDNMLWTIGLSTSGSPAQGTAGRRAPLLHTPASFMFSPTPRGSSDDLDSLLASDDGSSPRSSMENLLQRSSPIVPPAPTSHAHNEAAPAAEDEAAPEDDEALPAAEDAFLAAHRAARTAAQRRWRARRDLTAKDRVQDAMMDILTAATSSPDARRAVDNVLECATAFIQSVNVVPLGARIRAMETHFGMPPPGARAPAERVRNIMSVAAHDGAIPFEGPMLAGLAWAEAAARDVPAAVPAATAEV
jgi:hypothetical protein